MAADRTFVVPVPFSPHFQDCAKAGDGTWWVAVLTQRDTGYHGVKVFQYDVNGQNPVLKLAPDTDSWGAPRLLAMPDGGCVLASTPLTSEGVAREVNLWRLDGPGGVGFVRRSWWNSTTVVLVKQLQQLVAALGGSA